MFDVSWGELFVVTGLGFALVGRKDLPKAAGFVGNRVGRMVGLLQGARARADSFAQQNELHQLSNELKSGLRELDAVKSEMAVAMSSRGMQGGGMTKRTVLTMPQQQRQVPVTPTATTGSMSSEFLTSSTASSIASVNDISALQQQSATPIDDNEVGQSSSTRSLPPASQTIGAVAEEEWEKQGIGFRSRAERGVGLAGYNQAEEANPLKDGSSILASIYQQNLIFDQYDRVVQEQDEILQSKIDSLQAKNQKGREEDDDKKQS